jgi:hypothetical protein
LGENKKQNAERRNMEDEKSKKRAHCRSQQSSIRKGEGASALILLSTLNHTEQENRLQTALKKKKALSFSFHSDVSALGAAGDRESRMLRLVSHSFSMERSQSSLFLLLAVS